MTASILKQDENTQNVKKQQLILVRRYSVTEQNKFPLQAPFSGKETDG